MNQNNFTIAVGAKTPRDKKKVQIPEGWEPGFPEKTQTGNYYLNGSEKMVYFWDGNQWHRATKDIFGELTWHVSLQKQPNTKFHKLIKRITS